MAANERRALQVSEQHRQVGVEPSRWARALRSYAAPQPASGSRASSAQPSVEEGQVYEGSFCVWKPREGAYASE